MMEKHSGLEKLCFTDHKLHSELACKTVPKTASSGKQL